jgi:hypothetical protein
MCIEAFRLTMFPFVEHLQFEHPPIRQGRTALGLMVR